MPTGFAVPSTDKTALSGNRKLFGKVLGRGRRLAHELLGRVPVIYRADHRPNAVALTFDDGPSDWTLEIAAALEAHGCRGTFFLLGSAVEQRGAVVHALASAGHELGNHLWSHGDPENQTRSDLRSEINRTADAIHKAGGDRPRLVRPPYCGAPYAVAKAAAGTANSPLIVLRSVDPADWRAEGPDEIVDAVMRRTAPGDIICLHDGIAPNNRGSVSRSATAAAVARLVPILLQRGLRPVTVTELLSWHS